MRISKRVCRPSCATCLSPTQQNSPSHQRIYNPQNGPNPTTPTMPTPTASINHPQFPPSHCSPRPNQPHHSASPTIHFPTKHIQHPHLHLQQTSPHLHLQQISQVTTPTTTRPFLRTSSSPCQCPCHAPAACTRTSSRLTALTPLQLSNPAVIWIRIVPSLLVPIPPTLPQWPNLQSLSVFQLRLTSKHSSPKSLVKTHRPAAPASSHHHLAVPTRNFAMILTILSNPLVSTRCPIFRLLTP
jgi:hypothetical protein